jgi:hypothetical protein
MSTAYHRALWWLIQLLWIGNQVQVMCQLSGKQVEQSPAATLVENSMVYAIDEEKNRIQDFSYAGYKYGMAPIPTQSLPVIVRLFPASFNPIDDTTDDTLVTLVCTPALAI